MRLKKCVGGHADLKYGEAACIPNVGVVSNAFL